MKIRFDPKPADPLRGYWRGPIDDAKARFVDRPDDGAAEAAKAAYYGGVLMPLYTLPPPPTPLQTGTPVLPYVNQVVTVFSTRNLGHTGFRFENWLSR
jgi:hypothetical protein